MKNILALLPLSALMLFAGCTTKDVDPPGPVVIDPAVYYEINAPLAEYLEYNSIYQTTANNVLPEGIVIEHEGKWYLNKNLAATVSANNSTIYTNQQSGNATFADLVEKGYSGDFITSVDGLQYFVNVQRLYLSGSPIEGEFDASSFTNLKALQMNGSRVSSIINIPATLTDFRCNSANLTSVDLSACTEITNIVLYNGGASAQIGKDAIIFPEHPISSDITFNAQGCPNIPYLCSADFYAKVTTGQSYLTTTPGNLYELSDENFALYLMYNATLTSGEAQLPAGIVISRDGKYFLDTDKAATVGVVNLNQASGWNTPLINAGFNVTGKITDIDGIQFFTAVTKIVLTSGDLTGALDVSMLTNLTVLQMNTNYVNSISLPPSITQFNYNASESASAPSDRFLTSIDFSDCSGLSSFTIQKHNIEAGGFKAPLTPTASSVTGDMSGNPGIKYDVHEAFYNLLTASSKDYFQIEVPATPGPFSVTWDPTGLTGNESMVSPWTFASSSPANLRDVGIINTPQLVKGSGCDGSGSASNSNSWGSANFRRVDYSTAELSIQANYYFTFTVTSSLPTSFTSLKTSVLASASGPQNVVLQYSLDGVNFTDAATAFNFDGATSVANTKDWNVDLSSVSALQQVPAGTVTFRVVPYEGQSGGTSATGAIYIVSARDNITFENKAFVVTGTTLAQ